MVTTCKGLIAPSLNPKDLSTQLGQ